MFNEEMKLKFIISYTESPATADSARTLFKAIEPFEREWQADICTKTAEELQPVIDKVLGLQTRGRWAVLSILRVYFKWCMSREYPGAGDGIMHVETLGLDKIRLQMVVSPLHLQTYLDNIFDKEQEGTIDNVYRCFFWMGFAGMEERETLEVKTPDVDMSALVISLNGSDYPIYREAIPAFRNAVNLRRFLHKHPTFGNTDVWRERVLGNQLMRGMKADSRLGTLRSTLSRRLANAYEDGKTGQRLSFNRVRLSGLFYRMYELEKIDGEAPDFEPVVKQDMEGKTYSLKGGATLTQRRNQREREYGEDYQRWKLAFLL